jgi:hypothetical protein
VSTLKRRDETGTDLLPSEFSPEVLFLFRELWYDSCEISDGHKSIFCVKDVAGMYAVKVEQGRERPEVRWLVVLDEI